jgi:hypothetical protein
MQNQSRKEKYDFLKEEHRKEMVKANDEAVIRRTIGYSVNWKDELIKSIVR